MFGFARALLLGLIIPYCKGRFCSKTDRCWLLLLLRFHFCCRNFIAVCWGAILVSYGPINVYLLGCCGMVWSKMWRNLLTVEQFVSRANQIDAAVTFAWFGPGWYHNDFVEGLLQSEGFDTIFVFVDRLSHLFSQCAFSHWIWSLLLKEFGFVCSRLEVV